MTSTRPRHRASTSPFHWATRSVVAAAAVPVGALAGCVAAAASSHEAGLGLAGMTVAAVPLALHAWHARRAERDGRPAGSGRHSLDAAMDRVLEAMGTAAPAEDEVRVPAPRRAVDALIGAARAMTPASTARTTVAVSDVLLADAATATREADDIDLRPALDVDAPSTRAQRDSEIAKLRRLWDAGTGPMTGLVAALDPALVPAQTPAPAQAPALQAPALPAGQAA